MTEESPFLTSTEEQHTLYLRRQRSWDAYKLSAALSARLPLAQSRQCVRGLTWARWTQRSALLQWCRSTHVPLQMHGLFDVVRVIYAKLELRFRKQFSVSIAPDAVHTVG